MLLADEDGYLLAVIPATHRVDLGVLHRKLDRLLGLTTEYELSEMFPDCKRGAIPPLGEPYGLDVIVDDSLSNCQDIYFEAGDHADLVHVRGKDFQLLMSNALRGDISHHV